MDLITAHDLLQQVTQQGIIVEAVGDTLRCRGPKAVMTPELQATLKAHKPAVLKLLTAPEPDFLADMPCEVCGSRERWTWLDGRALCRGCLILDLAPLTLVRQGWPKDGEEALHVASVCGY